MSSLRRVDGNHALLTVEEFIEWVEEAYRQGWQDCALKRKLDESDAWWESATKRRLDEEVGNE